MAGCAGVSPWRRITAANAAGGDELLLGQLEQLGYLTRRDDPEDHRSKRIHLTKRGEAAAQNIRQTVRQIETELEREIGPEQFAQLRQLLIRLNATDVVRDRRTVTGT
jgi:DNA-binding PadR family transcriptional regulator